MLKVTPGLLEASWTGFKKFVPVNMTLTVVPGAPKLGVIAVSVGGGGVGVTLKTTELLVPAGVIAVMFDVPDAPGAIFRVNVKLVAVGTVPQQGTTPGLVDPIVTPEKFVPVMVTATEVPACPKFGVMDVIVGSVELMVKTTALLVPAEVFTVMFAVPVAPAAIAKVADA